MNEFALDMLLLSRLCSTVRMTSSGSISAKPCFVFFVGACPTDGAALYEGAVHNGETSNGDILVDIEAQYGQRQYIGDFPMYFNKGIYVALTTNMKSITIQYLEDVGHLK